MARATHLHKTDQFILRELSYRYGKVSKSRALQLHLAKKFPECQQDVRRLDSLALSYRAVIRDIVDYC